MLFILDYNFWTWTPSK